MNWAWTGRTWTVHAIAMTVGIKKNMKNEQKQKFSNLMRVARENLLCYEHEHAPELWNIFPGNYQTIFDINIIELYVFLTILPENTELTICTCPTVHLDWWLTYGYFSFLLCAVAHWVEVPVFRIQSRQGALRDVRRQCIQFVLNVKTGMLKSSYKKIQCVFW